MPRGRQYYDPIIQAPSTVEGQENKERIEVFPVGMDSPSRMASEVGKWASRRVDAEGRIIEQGPSAGEQNEAIRQAEATWPGLDVYFLTAEIEDSTWDGIGPTPRLWQQGRTEHDPPANVVPMPQPVQAETSEEVSVRAFSVEAGTYMHLDDIRKLLHSYADVYDENDNPSASRALRSAADMLGGE